MSILPQLERDLRDAARRRAAAGLAPADGRSRAARWQGSRALSPLRVALLAVAGLLAAATIALAASGVILTGSPVRPPGPVSPTVGLGVPTGGGAQLLGVRVADPAGGLPWGVRVVHTTRGVICLQVGRVENGQVGVLGVDGAFRDDGRFHPLAPDELRVMLSGLEVECTEGPSSTMSSVDDQGGVSADVSFPAGSSLPAGDRRVISYGLLGANAVGIRVRIGTRTVDAPVHGADGVYLIVARSTASTGRGTATSYGIDRPDGALLNPIGAVVGVSYRIHGRLCSNQRLMRLPACPQPDYVAPKVPVRHLVIHPQLTVRDGQVVALTVRFRAPYTITNVAQDYDLGTWGCPVNPNGPLRAFQSASLFRDVTAGTLVTLSVPTPFKGACGDTLQVSLEYSYPQAEQNLQLATAMLRRP